MALKSCQLRVLLQFVLMYSHWIRNEKTKCTIVIVNPHFFGHKMVQVKALISTWRSFNLLGLVGGKAQAQMFTFVKFASQITTVPLVLLLHGHVLFVVCFISKCNTIFKVPYTSRNCLHRNYQALVQRLDCCSQFPLFLIVYYIDASVKKAPSSC